MKDLNKQLLEEALMQNFVSLATEYEDMILRGKGSTSRILVIDSRIEEIAQNTMCATSNASLLAMIWYYKNHNLGENEVIDGKYKMMSKDSPVRNIIELFLDRKATHALDIMSVTSPDYKNGSMPEFYDAYDIWKKSEAKDHLAKAIEAYKNEGEKMSMYKVAILQSIFPYDEQYLNKQVELVNVPQVNKKSLSLEDKFYYAMYHAHCSELQPSAFERFKSSHEAKVEIKKLAKTPFSELPNVITKENLMER
ncbi:MAG: hypothetical protein IK070_03365 [Clostridia bacterium]|nr:hypothetical protein [Clostridia bacterium]